MVRTGFHPPAIAGCGATSTVVGCMPVRTAHQKQSWATGHTVTRIRAPTNISNTKGRHRHEPGRTAHHEKGVSTPRAVPDVLLFLQLPRSREREFRRSGHEPGPRLFRLGGRLWLRDPVPLLYAVRNTVQRSAVPVWSA